MIRARDSRVIAPSAREQRVVAQVVLEKARDFSLLSFSVADTHLHLENTCGAREAAELARRIELSLGRRLSIAVGFSPAYLEPIRDQKHLQNLFTYILKQDQRHGLDLDPYREASNLPDLLGMRLLGGYTTTLVRQLLPRINRKKLLEYLHVPALQPGEEPLELVVPAAEATMARVGLDGRTRELVDVRRAVVQVVGSRMAPSELAQMMGVDRRTITRLRAQPADARLVKAIRLQLALRASRPVEEGAF